MTFEMALAVLNSIYSDTNGFLLSFYERKKKGIYNQSLTYGEIVFNSFYEILKLVNPKKTDVFYDLGCGVGKAVLAAYLLFPFKKCIGVEILNSLYKECQNKKIMLEKKLLLKNRNPKEDIIFIKKDLFDVDFDDGDVFFISTTCFTKEMMNRLALKLEKLKKGTRIITLTFPIPSSKYTIIAKETKQVSWGNSTFYVSEKK